jgi:polyisoprenoid-binding protein YceI
MKNQVQAIQQPNSKARFLNLVMSGILIAGAAFVTTNSRAANVQVDPAKSTVHVVFKQMNVPVQAQFKKFTATID